MMVETAPAVVAVIAARRPVDAVLALRGLDRVASVVVEGEAAMDWLGSHAADVVVIEHEPGTLDAVALTQALRQQPRFAETPVLILTASDADAIRQKALAAEASDVVIRPVDPLDLQLRLRTLVALAAARSKNRRHAKAASRAVAEAAAREREIVRRLMRAAELRDDQAGDHLTRVAGCVIAIAEALGLPQEEAEAIALASTMHDLGKIGVPDDILLKAGPLTEAERKEMQRHPERGASMLDGSSSRLLQLAALIARTHHERWDGTGYPEKLAGEAIPLAGRIVAVADVFDALTAPRAYKPAWPLEKARAHIVERSGTHFDPACVTAFLSRWEDIAALVRSTSATAA